jgi:DNA-binding FrmR family transcriptional regulator
VSGTHKHKNIEDVIKRLSRIEGHVRGVKLMAAQGKSCEELLLQISAIRGALDKAGKLILDDHLEGCLIDIIKESDESDRTDALVKLKEAIHRFI